MTASTRPVRFFHRGQVVEHTAAVPTRTVLEWLREEARCTGTKEGCNEGDCGACTVVLGSLDDSGALQLAPVNACIQLLPMLDGKALFTVEDLAAADGTLHPVQQCMVQCHGSQCGFCTPGFVMSLWAGYQRRQAAGEVPLRSPSRQQLADELAGNLCRCTGYRPILDAGEQAYTLPPAPLDEAPVRAALQALAADPPLATGSGFFAPKSLEAFAALREARPGATVLAGSTDIGLWVTKQFRPLPELISVQAVAELRRITFTEERITVGAAATLEDAWRALAAEWPGLTELWLRFAGPPVRASGTLGGNVANGSPIGDAAPALMALGATLVLRKGARERRLALDSFYLGYMKNALEPGEFVQAMEMPRARPGLMVRGYKISKRFDCDISALCLGAAIGLDAAGAVAEVRLAFGGLAATVKRAVAAEAALRGRLWDEAALGAAVQALAQDFAPLTDLRASAGYRLRVAGALLRRLWLETRAECPLPAAATSVWARPGAEVLPA